jgi:hypothetical protein
MTNLLDVFLHLWGSKSNDVLCHASRMYIIPYVWLCYCGRALLPSMTKPCQFFFLAIWWLAAIHILCVVIWINLYLNYVFSRTAYDASINDDSWPTEAFELVSGEKSKTLEKLDPWVYFVTYISAYGVSVFSMTENDCLLQGCHSFPHICSGDQNTGQIPRITCYH